MLNKKFWLGVFAVLMTLNSIAYAAVQKTITIKGANNAAIEIGPYPAVFTAYFIDEGRHIRGKSSEQIHPGNTKTSIPLTYEVVPGCKDCTYYVAVIYSGGIHGKTQPVKTLAETYTYPNDFTAK